MEEKFRPANSLFAPSIDPNLFLEQSTSQSIVRPNAPIVNSNSADGPPTLGNNEIKRAQPPLPQNSADKKSVSVESNHFFFLFCFKLRFQTKISNSERYDKQFGRDEENGSECPKRPNARGLGRTVVEPLRRSGRRGTVGRNAADEQQKKQQTEGGRRRQKESEKGDGKGGKGM